MVCRFPNGAGNPTNPVCFCWPWNFFHHQKSCKKYLMTNPTVFILLTNISVTTCMFQLFATEYNIIMLMYKQKYGSVKLIPIYLCTGQVSISSPILSVSGNTYPMTDRHGYRQAWGRQIDTYNIYGHMITHTTHTHKHTGSTTTALSKRDSP